MHSQRRKPPNIKLGRRIKREVESLDPIEAARRAKEKKRQEELKAAAVAAAKAAPPDIRTYFPVRAPRTPEKQGALQEASSTMDATAAPALSQQEPDRMSDGALSSKSMASSQVTVQRSKTEDDDVDAGENPLASILGYGGDDAGTSDDEESTLPAQKNSDDMKGGERAEKDGLGEKGDPLDSELLSFMSELQASGLLKDDASETDDDSQDNAAPREDSAAHAALDSSEAEGAETAVLRSEGTDGGEEASSAAAQQRVLGDLDGCPGWSEVMDMSSGQVYFWHMETNEVVWDPPEGSRPRSDEEKAFLAQASDDPQPASGSNVQLPVRDSEAADVHRGVADEEDKYLSTAGEEPDSDHVMEDSLNLNRVQEGIVPDEVAQPSIPLPSEDIGATSAALVHMVWGAMEKISGGSIPTIVRLAVEAEVRWRDWQVFSGIQSAAAASRDPNEAFSWLKYESYIRDNMEALQNAALLEVPASEPEHAAPAGPTTTAAPVVIGNSSSTPAAAPVPRLQQSPSSTSSEELEDGEVPAPKEDDGDDMELDTEESELPPLPTEDDGGQDPMILLPVLPADDEDPPPIPEDAPPLPSDHPPAPQIPNESELPPLPPEPVLPPDAVLPVVAPLPAEDAAPPLPEAAQVLTAALTMRSTSPVLAPTPPVVKRKEYRAEPVYVAPVMPLEPVQLEAFVHPPAEPPPLGEVEWVKKRPAGAPVATTKKRAKLAKGASSLINKWQQVRKHLEQEEQKEEEVLDAEALERKRLREVEEWRLNQLRAGTTPEENANFQPLAVDWREKIKAKKKDEKTADEQPSDPAAKPDLKALSAGLPEGWRAMWDKGSGSVYYGNLVTKETTWDRPS